LPSKNYPVRSKLKIKKRTEQVLGLRWQNFGKAINQSRETSAQFHFSIQLNFEIFDVIRYPKIVEVSKFNASSRSP
jgi:hypothetical protein